MLSKKQNPLVRAMIAFKDLKDPDTSTLWSCERLAILIIKYQYCYMTTDCIPLCMAYMCMMIYDDIINLQRQLPQELLD